MPLDQEWPNNGIEQNLWYKGITRFITVLKHFEWIKDSRFKYVNIRIDTRNGNFLVLHDMDRGSGRVDPLEIAKHVDMDQVDGRQREEGVNDIIKPYLTLINETPRLMSLLYDIDMMPEQTISRAGAVRLAGLCEVWKMRDREHRTGEYVLNTAKSLGWRDDGEGALEYLLRRTREVAIEDCGEHST